MTSTETRQTRQRAAILNHLARTDEFATAQQIQLALSADGTPVSLPTVYRTLAALAEAGQVDQVTANGQSAYRRCSPEHHHHLRCRACGRTIEVTGQPVERWAAAIAAEHGFTEPDHVTEITGVCPACREATPTG